MSVIAKSLSSTITLSDGITMPLYGLGMSWSPGEIIEYAIRSGFKLLDSATLYKNEDEVGRAIKKTNIKREDLFIVSKVWDHGKENCMKEFSTTLTSLNVPYLDLYLIHHPLTGQVLETYDTMLELKQQGLIRSVGVSNFGIHHLEALKAAGRPLPSVNQIELNPFMHRRELVDYCQKEGITVMGYSPLGKMKKADDPYLNELASKYHKTVAQVMIRWSVQKGYIVIPKSTNAQRLVDNTDVFDFELTEEEMDKLDSNPECRCTAFETEPTLVPWQG